jgi:small subunit ribosomal protein S11
MPDATQTVEPKPAAAAPAAAAAPTAEAPAPEGEVKKAPKKKVKRLVKSAYIHIHAGFNNTLLTATDPNGGVLCRASSGASGFKGTKKSTPYAAQVAAEKLCEKIAVFGTDNVNVYVNGVGPGREQAVRGLAKTLHINLIVDRTAVPHNGPRARKRRRV